MLEHYFQPIIDYLRIHPGLGMLAAFVISFLESLPIIGTIIPGSITMTAIGTLIGAGIIPGVVTLLWASVGAFMGDTAGYLLGRQYQGKIHQLWPFSRWPKLITYSEDFFHKHGGKSIVIGRFVGPARSTVPLVAGILRLSWPRFIIAAAPSAIFWAIMYMVPGILLGAISLELPPGKTTEFILIGLAVIVILWLLFWLIQRFFRSILNFINRQIDRYWSWLYRHHSSRFLINYITNQQHPEDHQQLTMVLLSALFGLLFLGLFLAVGTHNIILRINYPLFHFMQSCRIENLTKFFLYITLFATPKMQLAEGVLFAFALFWRRQWRASAHMLALSVISAGAVMFFKTIYHSPRPTGFLVTVHSSSFPSGHTTMALINVGFIAFLSCQLIGKQWRWIPYLSAGIITVLVAVSRLYLGAHWVTDVTGSVLLGLALLLACIVHYRRFPKSRSRLHLPKWLWGTIILIIFCIPWIVYGIHKYPATKYRYTPNNPKLNIKIQQWWKNPLIYIPMARENRFGRYIQPLNIQWAAPLADIKTLLRQHHWKEIERLPTVKNTLRNIVKYIPEYHLPIWPQLYRHQLPALLFIYVVKPHKKIIELRLWNAKVIFSDSKLPLWVGSVSMHNLKRTIHIFKDKSHIHFKANGSVKLLLSKLSGYQARVLTVPRADQPKALHHLHWKGQILVVVRH